MPNKDGTGPEFAGPMTGGAHGWCAEDNQMAVVGDSRGMAFGRGRGYRQGRRRRSRPGMGVGRFGHRPGAWVHSAVVGQNHLQQMERQAAGMQQHLNAINQRIESLKPKPAE